MEILSVNNLGYYYKDGEDKRVIFDDVNVSHFARVVFIQEILLPRSLCTAEEELRPSWG